MKKIVYFQILMVWVCLFIATTTTVSFTSVTGHTKERANSYDEGWDSKWKATVDSILKVSEYEKVEGKTLHVGDSMTVSMAYGLWATNYKAFHTDEDSQTIQWMKSATRTDDNGWKLSGNLTTSGNGMGWHAAKINSMLENPVVYNAQYAVLMMNTNVMSNVISTIDKFIAKGIVPILSTVPPRVSDTGYVENNTIPFNNALRSYAEERGLPFIDYYEEIVLRRPNGTWAGTLISDDGVHPSGTRGEYTPKSDPYTPGGDAAAHETGDAALNSGYLLRTWLTVQKMKEIRTYVQQKENK